MSWRGRGLAERGSRGVYGSEVGIRLHAAINAKLKDFYASYWYVYFGKFSCNGEQPNADGCTSPKVLTAQQCRTTWMLRNQQRDVLLKILGIGTPENCSFHIKEIFHCPMDKYPLVTICTALFCVWRVKYLSREKKTLQKRAGKKVEQSIWQISEIF